MEAADKSGKLKLTIELDVNPALMDLVKENMSNMMEMAQQWGKNMGQGGKGKMGEGMGMMHHGSS
ncbi:MAG: hypothetical protein ACQCN6_05310 [Candidatus Bathyarchaeia archaeon]